MKNNKFFITDEVRDNELDAQGIVNNANYMIYLSHARHKHVLSLGLDFNEYAKNNQKLILLSSNIKFKNSLVANDRYIVSSDIIKTEYPYQWAYAQDIKRESDGKIILKAISSSTCVNSNADEGDEKLYVPEIIKAILDAKE